MSQRETKAKPLLLTTVGGVNQRVLDTELPPSDYSDNDNVFPEFAGLQSRIWGKRLLALYPDPIYGIHQFWTPLGYGGGLYQFQDALDFGYWLTPTTLFNLSIPTLGVDGGGYTLDEFGQGYGSNFGYGTDNTCLISFLNGGTDHSSCNPAPSQMGTPDDSNGGPAGQGRHCAWEEVVEDLDLLDYISAQQVGTVSNVVQLSDTDNCRNPADGQNPPCVAFPTLPAPLAAIPDPSSYTTQIINGILSASKLGQTAVAFTPATNLICTFRTTVNQGNTVSNNKLTINLAPLVGGYFDSAHLVVTKTPGGEVEIPLIIEDAVVILNANDYLTLGAAIPNGNNGYDQSGSVVADTIRTRRRARVCA